MRKKHLRVISLTMVMTITILFLKTAPSGPWKKYMNSRTIILNYFTAIKVLKNLQKGKSLAANNKQMKAGTDLNISKLT